MSKRILVISNAASVWTRELIRNVHIPLNHKVHVLSFDPAGEQERFYRETETELTVLGGRSGAVGKVEKALQLMRFSRKYRDSFDLVVLHGPPHSAQAHFLQAALKALSCPVLTVFWGSDIQALPDSGVANLDRILRASSAVNLSTQAMREAYQNRFPENKLPIWQAKFGLTAFEHIDRVRNETGREACLLELGLDPGKTCIAVGYNGGKQQQHLAAIQALGRLNEQEKVGIQMLIHMGYQRDEDYIAEVQQAADQTGIPYKLLLKQLPMAEIAKLRVATDIMLHAQTNDAMSGTIRECLYAGAILVNPEWIRYDEFDQMGVEYVKYPSFDELTNCIRQVLQKESSVDTRKNTRLMAGAYSWDAVRADWQKAMESCMESR